MLFYIFTAVFLILASRFGLSAQEFDTKFSFEIVHGFSSVRISLEFHYLPEENIRTAFPKLDLLRSFYPKKY